MYATYIINSFTKHCLLMQNSMDGINSDKQVIFFLPLANASEM